MLLQLFLRKRDRQTDRRKTKWFFNGSVFPFGTHIVSSCLSVRTYGVRGALLADYWYYPVIGNVVTGYQLPDSTNSYGVKNWKNHFSGVPIRREIVEAQLKFRSINNPSVQFKFECTYIVKGDNTHLLTSEAFTCVVRHDLDHLFPIWGTEI